MSRNEFSLMEYGLTRKDWNPEGKVTLCGEIFMKLDVGLTKLSKPVLDSSRM